MQRQKQRRVTILKDEVYLHVIKLKIPMTLNLPQKQQVKSDFFYGNYNTTQLPPLTAFVLLQRAGLETPVLRTNVHGNVIMQEEISKCICD